MKVVCQQCSATYAINDAQIPAKGARAQCPRCKHQQQVFREEAAAPAAAPAPAAPAAAPVSGAPFASLDAPRPAAAPASVDPFAGIDLGKPASRPASGDPFASLDLGKPAPKPASGDPFANLDLGKPAPKPASGDPFANLDLGKPAPKAASGDPFANLDLGKPAPRAASSDPFAGIDLGKPAPSKPTSDPFAGLDLAKPAPAPALVAPPAAPLVAPRRAESGSGAVRPAPAPVQESAPPPPPAQPSRPPDGRSALPMAPSTVVSGKPGAGAGRSVAIALGGLLVVGGAVFGVKAVAPSIFLPKPEAPALPPELEILTGTWKTELGQIEGRPAELLEKARDLRRLDRLESHQEAATLARKAAVLAGTDLKGVSTGVVAWVEASLLAQAMSAVAEPPASTVSALEAALKALPGDAGALRARVYLLIAQGPRMREEARVAARQAEQASLGVDARQKAETLLAAGAAYSDSAQVAVGYLDRAIQSDPELRRAYQARAFALSQVGHYRKAADDLEKRLSFDGEARGALLELGALHAALGNIPEAKRTLQRLRNEHGDLLEGRLALSVLEYQGGGVLAIARGNLETLAREALDAGNKTLAASALAHFGAVAREMGDLERARTAIAQALEADPSCAAAQFQRALVAMEQKKPAEARAAVDALQKLGVPSVRLEALQGRVAFAEGRPDEGGRSFLDALTRNPIDLRAALLGAALSMQAGKADAAYQLISKAMEIDPLLEQRHRAPTEFYESLRSELSALQKGFPAADKSVAQPIACDGVLRFHLGDLAGARRRFEEALKIDPLSLPALLYLAELELDAKSLPKAKVWADKAHDAERGSALGSYLQGRVAEAQGSIELARQKFTETYTQQPAFTGAMLRQGQILAAAGEQERATSLFLKVFFADPLDTDCHAGLFKLGY